MSLPPLRKLRKRRLQQSTCAPPRDLLQHFTKLPRMSASDLDDGQVPVQLPELSNSALVLVQRGLWPCLGFLPAVERSNERFSRDIRGDDGRWLWGVARLTRAPT